MKILIPSTDNLLHPYLKELVNHSKDDFEQKDLFEIKDDYPVINIHWPEAIFGWHEPTKIELKELERELKRLKSFSRIVYTKHDYHRNKGTTSNFTNLFKLIEEYTDVFIHLGNYSKNLYEKKYPKVRHVVIYHPFFDTSFRNITTKEARSALSIEDDAFVVTAAGQIRNHAERDLVMRSFKGLKIEGKRKVLIATNMLTELRFDFKGRTKIRPYLDVHKFFTQRFKSRFQPPNYHFNYGPLEPDEFGLRIAAADVILIPRIDTLNSGNIFLGLTFNKIIVGPAIGNMKETLELFTMPTFNPPSSISIIEAMEKAYAMANSDFSLKKHKRFLPTEIAFSYSKLFREII